MAKYQNICQLVRDLEQDYLTGTVKISQYVDYSMYQDISMIDAYLNSTHLSGSVDSLQREKPFYNIVVPARNIRFRATDIDTKDIKGKAQRARDFIVSVIVNALLHDWMKKTDFGWTLNEWGMVLAGYDTAILKFVENDEGLKTLVMDWNKMIVDPIDFAQNPKIEVLYFTEAQLRQNEYYDQEVVDSLCNSLAARQTQNRQNVDTRSDYIKVYEVHGNLPLSFLTGQEDDEYTFTQQMHVVSFVGSGNSKGSSQYSDYTLYSGKEAKDPYMITYLTKENGKTLSNGVVKQLETAQWMVNHSMKAQKDIIDITSKIGFQTNDPNYANQNLLTSFELGQIMTYGRDSSPLTRIDVSNPNITSIVSFSEQWQMLGNNLASTPDILYGNNLPSGTAYRQAAIVQQEAHSNFEMMIENKGLAIQKMMKEYVLPYLKKKFFNSKDEIMAVLDSVDITKIDSAYIPREAIRRFNKKAVEAVINQQPLPNMQQEIQGVQNELSQFGNQRFFVPSDIEEATWKEALKDVETIIDFDPTGEMQNKQVLLETLNNLMDRILQNPQALDDPRVKLIYDKIVENTGVVSPLELSSFNNTLKQQPAAPQGQPVAVGQGQPQV